MAQSCNLFLETECYDSPALQLAYIAANGTNVDLLPLMMMELHHYVMLQARNNARAVVAGSIDMFSNEYFKATLGGPRYYSAQSAVPGSALCITCDTRVVCSSVCYQLSASG